MEGPRRTGGSADQDRAEANRYLVWLSVYRNGPLLAPSVAELTRLGLPEC